MTFSVQHFFKFGHHCILLSISLFVNTYKSRPKHHNFKINSKLPSFLLLLVINMASPAAKAVSSNAPPKGPVVCVLYFRLHYPPWDPPLICLSCGSSPGTSPAHLAAARDLAREFHAHGVSLVYGGGTVGIMGEIAKTLVSLSGPSSVHGIIPDALIKFEQQGRDSGKPSAIDASMYGRTTVVKDMHSRKHMMAKCVMEGGTGSGFVALSGGYGTMEELMEMVTWNQLGIHRLGVVVFNVDGFYDGLLTWVKSAVKGGFVSEANRGIMVEALTAETVVKALKEYKISEGRFKLDWTEK